MGKCRTNKLKLHPQKKLHISVERFVGLPGFEPRQTESKSVVLPLHHNPISHLNFFGIAKIRDLKNTPKVFLLERLKAVSY